MAQTEFVQMLLTGEQATIVGPGVVEFKTLAQGTLPTKAMGTGGMVGKGIITTTGTASAKAVPAASIFSGKFLGFSLASVNPWMLVAIGVAGGYMLAKKRYPKLVW